MKKIDVKFNSVRWLMFTLAIFVGWFIALLLSWKSFFRVMGGAFLGMVVYFYFYFNDRRINNNL